MAPKRTPGGFGSKLREARERRGITLREIANATKISMSVLEALERNDVSRLPGGIFGRAFVRSYAIEVGLDPEETIQEFVAQLPQDSATAGPAAGHIEDNESLESDRRMASAFLRLIAISVPAAAAVLYFGFAERRPAPDPPAPIAMTARAEASTPSGSSFSTPSAAAPTAAGSGVLPASASADSVQPTVAGELDVDRLTVALVATGDCWVSATVDGQRVVERELRTGERQQFDVRRELELTAGDPGRLTLTFNGAEVRPLGRSGQKVTARVNLTNFKDYLAGNP